MYIPYKGKTRLYRGIQVHKVKGTNDYMFVLTNTLRVGGTSTRYYDVYFTLEDNQVVPCCHGSATYDYIEKSTYKQSYAQLPKVIKQALHAYVGTPEEWNGK